MDTNQSQLVPSPTGKVVTQDWKHLLLNTAIALAAEGISQLSANVGVFPAQYQQIIALVLFVIGLFLKYFLGNQTYVYTPAKSGTVPTADTQATTAQ